MEPHEDLSILGKELNTYLATIKVSSWAHFARYSLEQLLAMPDMTFENLKTISRRLHLKGLDLSVDNDKLEQYYQQQLQMSLEQVEKEQLLDTSIEDFFGYRPKIINNLKRENLKTLRDLTSLDIEEVIKFRSIGVHTLTEMCTKLRDHGLYFTSKLQQPKPKSYD